MKTKLTPKEKQIGALLLDKLTVAQCAERLGCSKSAVKFHITNLNCKLNCKSRTELIVKLKRELNINNKNIADAKYAEKHYIFRESKGYVYDPRTTRTIHLQEMIGRDDFTVTDSQGRDVTEVIKQKVSQRSAQLLAAEAKRQKKRKLKEKVREAEAGFYCDCHMSSKFDTPEQVPDSYIEPDKPSKFTRIEALEDQTCPFCGYYSVYYEEAPSQGSNKRLTDKGLKSKVDNGGTNGVCNLSFTGNIRSSWSPFL